MREEWVRAVGTNNDNMGWTRKNSFSSRSSLPYDSSLPILATLLRSELVDAVLGGGPSGTGCTSGTRPGARLLDAELDTVGAEPVAAGGSASSASTSLVRSEAPRIDGESCGEALVCNATGLLPLCFEILPSIPAGVLRWSGRRSLSVISERRCRAVSGGGARGAGGGRFASEGEAQLAPAILAGCTTTYRIHWQIDSGVTMRM